MLKVCRCFYRLCWSESGNESMRVYQDFNTAEEADLFIKEELKDAKKIEVEKHFILERGNNG